MKVKTTASILVLSVLLGALALVTIRQSSKPAPDILFDYVRSSRLSPFEPKFTQIKRVTLRRSVPDHLQLIIQLAAPLRLKPQDRLLVRVTWEDKAFVFPIGYSYASTPPLHSGDVGITLDRGLSDGDQKLLTHVPCSFGEAKLTATFNPNSLPNYSLAWDEHFLLAEVLYIPGSAGGLKAYYKGVNMTDSAASVDFQQLQKGQLVSWGMPTHPGLSWDDEKPTTLPHAVRAEDRNTK